MKILVSVELNVEDSPTLVTQVEMPTPRTVSENARAVAAYLDKEEEIIKRSIKLTKYQVRGKRKRLKSIRCPHCKFNYTQDGKDFYKLLAQFRRHKGAQEIIRCTCGNMYLVREVGDFFEMEW